MALGNTATDTTIFLNSNGTLRRSTNSGTSFTTVVSVGGAILDLAVLSRADLSGAAISLDGVSDASVSPNGGTSWTTTAVAGGAFTGNALLRDGIYYTTKETGGANVQSVFTSTDFITFTNRTGDLATKLGVATNAYIPYAVVPDWTT